MVEVRCSSLSSCMEAIVELIIGEGVLVCRDSGECMHEFWDGS